MSKGGGGQSGETTYNWNDTMAPLWAGALEWGGNLADPSGFGAYDQYGGQRIADINSTQNAALNSINWLANNGGTNFTTAGRDVGYNTLAGGFMPGTAGGNQFALQMNPFASLGNGYADQENAYASLGNGYAERLNPLADLNNPEAMNPFTNANTTTARNQYSGMNNPAFNDMLRSGMSEITDAYQKGTAAETQKNFNLAGIYGGDAHAKAVEQNQQALGKNLSQFASGMFSDQYNRSAGLEESYLGRDVANQQYNRSLGSNLYENMLGRAYGGAESQLARGNADAESWLARMYGSSESQLQRGNADAESWLNRMYQAGDSRIQRGYDSYEAERARQMAAIGLGQADQGTALQLANAQLGAGDVWRSHEQDLLNLGYGDWQDQQNQQYRMIDFLTGLYSRAQGGMSPNSTFTQSGYQASPYSNILGTALAGYGMFRS